MTPETIARMFTQPDGSFFCARWRRPVVPVVFGVAPQSLPVIKGAIEAVVALAGHRMAETDPEIGANLMLFFCSSWSELEAVPDLGHLLPDLGALVARLEREGARQYRLFRHEADGAIRAAVVLVRLDARLGALPAEVLALDQAVRVIALWGPGAFAAVPALIEAEGRIVLGDQVAALIRAVYDPVLPSAARDPSHALRLAGRMTASGTGPGAATEGAGA